MSRWLRAALQAGAGGVVLVAVVHVIGAGPFRQALDVLTPTSVLAALALGGVTTCAQGLRWRAVVMARRRLVDCRDVEDVGAAPAMTARRAVAECYRAGVLNAVLPGGLAGDVLRAHRARQPPTPPVFEAQHLHREHQHREHQRKRARWLRSAAAVGVERLAGTALLLAVGAVVLAAAVEDLAAGWIAALAAAALLLVAVVVRATASATAAAHLAVWGWSAVGLGALLALVVVAAVTLAAPTSSGEGAGGGAGPPAGMPGRAGTAVLAVLALLGMSLPVGLGGFGPREAIAAAAAGAVGTTPASAVSLTAGYGVLALLSTAPGAVLLVVDLAKAARRRRAEA